MIQIAIDFVTIYYIPILIWWIVGGCIYAVSKWTILLLKLRGQVNRITEYDLEKIKYSTDTPELTLQRCRENLAGKIFGQRTYPPLVSENKGNLMMWATFWPINLVWTMIADVAKEFFSMAYRKFGAVLQAISNSILPR